MKLANSTTEYGAATRVLHWSVALLVLGLIVLGWWMVRLSYYDRWYNDALALHKALGVLALVLGPLAVLWYLGNRRVAFADGLGTYERIAARTVHALLLALVVIVPASGYVISTSAGDGISVFGLLEVPAVVTATEASRDLAIATHYYAAYAVAVLAAVHAAGALKHQVLDRDGTLRKMLW